MPDTLEDAPPKGHHPLRRGLLVGLALTAVCALIWALSSAIVASGGLGNPHGEEVRELDAGTIAGDVQGVADLHGHLNYVVWGSGDLDVAEFLATAERTVELTDDPVVATLVEAAVASVRVGELYTAHDQVERAEDRLARRER